MARKPKKGAAAEAEAPKPIAISVTPEVKLKKLIKQCKVHKGAANEATSAMGGIIADAVEKNHLHKSAFAWARKLEAMDPVKLATHLAHFDHYRDVLGLDEIAREQGQMFARTEAGAKPGADAEEAGEGDGETGNVSSLAERRAAGSA